MDDRDQQWITLGRELADVVRMGGELEARRREIVDMMITMLREEREAQLERAPLVRVPEWARRRQEEFAAEQGGGITRLVSASAPLSELSAEAPCPGVELCTPAHNGRAHVHTADGVLVTYE